MFIETTRVDIFSVRFLECFRCCIQSSKKEATLLRGSEKENLAPKKNTHTDIHKKDLKDIGKDLLIIEAAGKYAVLKKKNTYGKGSETFFRNLEKTILCFLKTEDTSVAIGHTLLWKPGQSWEYWKLKQSIFFLTF